MVGSLLKKKSIKEVPSKCGAEHLKMREPCPIPYEIADLDDVAAYIIVV